MPTSARTLDTPGAPCLSLAPAGGGLLRSALGAAFAVLLA